jgi:hypothetical protein
MEILVSDNRLAGYSYLIEKLGIVSIPNWHRSTVSSTGTHFSKIEDGFVDEMFRNQYWPGETIGDHLEFAIKYDGVNLTLLAQIFEKIPVEELIYVCFFRITSCSRLNTLEGEEKYSWKLKTILSVLLINSCRIDSVQVALFW